MGLPFGDNISADGGEERTTRQFSVTTVAGVIVVDAEDEQQAIRLARGFKGGASVITVDEVSKDEEYVGDTNDTDVTDDVSDPFASERTVPASDDAPSGVDGRQAGTPLPGQPAGWDVDRPGESPYQAPAAPDFEGPVGTPHPASDSPADGSDRREGI